MRGSFIVQFSSLISAHQVTFLWDLYISMNRPFRVPRAYLVGPDVMMIAFHKHIIKKQYSGGELALSTSLQLQFA